MWTLSLTADHKVLLQSVVKIVQRKKPRETTQTSKPGQTEQRRYTSKPGQTEQRPLHPNTAREKRDSHRALPSIALEEGCG